ncbi:OsmC family protein [Idiomarina xiamenensis]|uniref:Organic hydroperoxide reductase n=1 Tax=Idiomarina xiamenensis 10-D-4 TaxID=740709 RepID=K2KD28_9GAMM|nr:OsmC family protein [Idiomarina xiamenensis]EKE80609.1 organic hydroperoxide reductase [Idiomarina xiamenensis 10-D-4]
MKRKASAVWQGSLKQGKGRISSDSGVLDNAQYAFGTRFEDGKGTNPEELIAAAHAGCFSMALSMMLGEIADVTPEQIDTQAAVSLEKDGDGFKIAKVHLTVKVQADIDGEKFQEIANKAKAGCPVSRVLNADISMDAELV